MQSHNFRNDDDLYSLINVSDNFEEINTDRTEELVFNSNPINWNRKLCSNKDIVTNYRINDNNSSIGLPEHKVSLNKDRSALDKVDKPNLPINFLRIDQYHEDNNSIDLTPRSQYCISKAHQNIENLLPQSFKSKLTHDVIQGNTVSYISCPECQMKNVCDLDWCLSCGLFLIKQKKSNFVSNTSFENTNNLVIESHINKNGNHFKSRVFESSKDFDRIYKRSFDTSDENLRDNQDVNSIKNFEETQVEAAKETLTSDSINWTLPESDKQMNFSNLNINFSENPKIKSNNVMNSLRPVSVPPLDLSLSHIDDKTQILGERSISSNHQCYRNKDDSKENKKKPHRRWMSSSIAWDNQPEQLLKKKPGHYYRKKLNSCSNKIGVKGFSPKIEPIWFSEDEVNAKLSRESLIRTAEMELVLNNCNCERSPECAKSNCNITDSFVASCIDISNNWQCLPAEIWIKIMMYLLHCDLSRLQQTCRRFYSIGLDSQLWRCVRLFRNNNLTDMDIINIAQKMPKELHFQNCFGTSITFNGLREMFNICGRGVEKLSFISCSKGALEGDQFLLLSAAFCPNVTHINASYLMNLQDSTLISMTEGFNKIVSLNLMGAHSISNESIKSLIKNHRSSLTSLDLYGCFRLNSATLRILEECLNLKSLALGSINKLKRASMVDLLRKLSLLINLDLRGTMNLIDDLLLEQICVLCPNLQQIVLTNSCLVGNQGLHSLANSNVSKSLKVLDICGCSRIDDKGAEFILKHCLSLEDLDISCTGITGRITKLFNTYPPPSLKCLRVNNNKLISETELASIVKSCKRLSTVYMCGITSIETWRSLEAKYKHILFKHE